MDCSIVRQDPSRKRLFCQHNAGFTLIELLVAITILAILALMGWRGLDSIIRTRTILTQEMEQTRSLQITFAQFESDCARAADASWFPQHDLLRSTDAGLVMIRKVYDEVQPVRLQVVVYRLVDGVLSRRESPATRELQELDMYWQSALNGTEIFTPVNLMNNIASFNITTYPQSTATPAPPATGLQISVTLRDQENPMSKIFLLGLL